MCARICEPLSAHHCFLPASHCKPLALIIRVTWRAVLIQVCSSRPWPICLLYRSISVSLAHHLYPRLCHLYYVAFVSKILLMRGFFSLDCRARHGARVQQQPADLRQPQCSRSFERRRGKSSWYIAYAFLSFFCVAARSSIQLIDAM